MYTWAQKGATNTYGEVMHQLHWIISIFFLSLVKKELHKVMIKLVQKQNLIISVKHKSRGEKSDKPL